MPAQSYRVDGVKRICVDGGLAKDVEVDSLVHLYEDSIKSELNRVVGRSSATLEAVRPDSPMASLWADILIETAQPLIEQMGVSYPVVSLANIGGIRSIINEGDIRVSDVFEVSPFENEVVIVFLRGKVLTKMLEHVAARGGEGLGAIKMTMKDGHLIEATVNGKEISRRSMYALVTLDYIATGGDDFGMLDNQKRSSVGKLFRTAIWEYIERRTARGEALVAPVEPRIIKCE